MRVRRRVSEGLSSLDISRSKMTQLDLFVPPVLAPAPEPPVRVRVRKPRPPALGENGFPISDETKGPLSAVESYRVATGHGIAWVGWIWEKGAVACKACVEAKKVEPFPEGQGYRASIFSDSRGQACGACIGCGAQVHGEHCLQNLPGYK